MKLRHVLAAVMSVAVMGGACATTSGPSPAPTAMAGYSASQVQRIMELREGGESLAAVAQQVGGSRADVRIVEGQCRTRLHMRAVVSAPLAIEVPR